MTSQDSVIQKTQQWEPVPFKDLLEGHMVIGAVFFLGTLLLVGLVSLLIPSLYMSFLILVGMILAEGIAQYVLAYLNWKNYIRHQRNGKGSLTIVLAYTILRVVLYGIAGYVGTFFNVKEALFIGATALVMSCLELIWLRPWKDTITTQEMDKKILQTIAMTCEILAEK